MVLQLVLSFSRSLSNIE
uniref:Uncharacterized protein n=1 Tax=Anguilla anguilla TaxID=7936 RepID=A0A0E9XYJ3_ANGAN